MCNAVLFYHSFKFNTLNYKNLTGIERQAYSLHILTLQLQHNYNSSTKIVCQTAILLRKNQLITKHIIWETTRANQ